MRGERTLRRREKELVGDTKGKGEDESSEKVVRNQ